MCFRALGRGSWIKEGAGRWDRHEDRCRARRFRALGTTPEAKHRGGSLYVVGLGPCGLPPHRKWGCRTHMRQGVIGLLGLSFPGLSRWPKAPQRRRELCPLALDWPLEGCILPLVCRPALRVLPAQLSQNSQAVSGTRQGAQRLFMMPGPHLIREQDPGGWEHELGTCLALLVLALSLRVKRWCL